MPDRQTNSMTELADDLSLRVQQLRDEGLFGEDDVLLNLDYSQQAAAAPFVFDMVLGTLHRNGCGAIPETSESALYAVTAMSPSDAMLACPVCRPEPMHAVPATDEGTLDLICGVLSILDQFGSVLRERGREFRKSGGVEPYVKRLEAMLTAHGQASRSRPQDPAIRCEPAPAVYV